MNKLDAHAALSVDAQTPEFDTLLEMLQGAEGLEVALTNASNPGLEPVSPGQGMARQPAAAAARLSNSSGTPPQKPGRNGRGGGGQARRGGEVSSSGPLNFSKNTASIKLLAETLVAEFEDARKSREPYEHRWVEDVRQYRGMYADSVEQRMARNRSRLYLNITKQKVDSTKARLMSLLFPSTSENNWSIQPTPEPNVPPELLELEQQAAEQEGRQPKTPDLLAKEAAERMCRKIADQLAETQGRPNYRACCGSIIHQGLLHGTGILKGPLVNFNVNRRLSRDPQTGMYGLYEVESGELSPYFEVVPIWHCYLDSSTTTPEAMRFVWQTHIMSAQELLETLAKSSLFDSEAIVTYVRDHPQGDWKPYAWESEIRSIATDKGSIVTYGGNACGRYRVYERWGQLTGEQLRSAGFAIPESEDMRAFDAQVWVLGDQIIKIAPLPVTGFGLPFQLFYYHKDETSIWGEGLAWTLKDVQDAINASIRMLIDNAAITSGPIIGLNVSALARGQKPDELRPFHIFQFDSAEDMRQALTLWQMRSNTPEIMNIYNLLLQMADEMSVPRYLAGDNSALRGAGETASGLSMLMNAANLTIQDLVRSFDDGITAPFIRNLYLWNMIFTDDPFIKGDFDVVAVGSSSLLVREAEGQRLLQALSIFAAPQFAGRIKEDELLKDILQKFNLPDHILRTTAEFEEWKAQTAMEAMAAMGGMGMALGADQGAALNPQGGNGLLDPAQGALQLPVPPDDGQDGADGDPGAGAPMGVWE